tara:strand:+ start:111 stop:269 length:159 start_codon:yes stop_codon:yes gene_type:complete
MAVRKKCKKDKKKLEPLLIQVMFRCSHFGISNSTDLAACLKLFNFFKLAIDG